MRRKRGSFKCKCTCPPCRVVFRRRECRCASWPRKRMRVRVSNSARAGERKTARAGEGWNHFTTLTHLPQALLYRSSFFAVATMALSGARPMGKQDLAPPDGWRLVAKPHQLIYKAQEVSRRVQCCKSSAAARRVRNHAAGPPPAATICTTLGAGNVGRQTCIQH